MRVVGPGGSNPLAPTKLTEIASELVDGRQGGIEPEFDRLGHVA